MLNKIRSVCHWRQAYVECCGEGRIEFMFAKSPDATSWAPQTPPSAISFGQISYFFPVLAS
ncbi:rCG30059, partial [Rattus norvegicus]